MTALRIAAIGACLSLGAALPAVAQEHHPPTSRAADCAKIRDMSADHGTMDHAAHQAAMRECAGSLPTSPGSAAFGAIGEIVRLLQADPKTDWTKVNIEALRQHLIDMDHVTTRSDIVQRNLPGGIEVEVTGAGRTMLAIKRIAMAHSAMLDGSTEYVATAQEIRNGARIRVVAKDASNTQLVAKIRGLGFAGLMTEGDHHARHHLELARGSAHAHAR